MFSKILVANRGEIAVRIIRACKEMGIATVAVYSEEDRNALHVALADQSYCIGGAEASGSYLNENQIISTAILAGAQAIHPGYGFLSENAHFARLCRRNGLVFIGPDPDKMERLSDKAKLKELISETGLSVIPGTKAVASAEEAKRLADKIGYPVMLKACAGGGGRGIRLIHAEEELEDAYLQATAEAVSAFGDGSVYLEKYIFPARHVELQILADEHGNAVCLGDRDCSLQRRNQKLLEETPSPAVSEEQRRKMIELAVDAVKKIGYVGAGTLEFLLDREGNFWFMEMNVRLQVEHCVTEMLTGIDLVKWQIRIAAGIPLNITQEEIRMTGSAVECRINAGSCGMLKMLPAITIYLLWETGDEMALLNFMKPMNELEEGGRTSAPVQRDAGEPEKKCPNCHKEIPLSRLWANDLVCACGYHFRMKARQHIQMIADKDSFRELFSGMHSDNPLNFPGYREKIETVRAASGEKEAVVCGTAMIGKQRCCLFVMESYFMMGSMGSAVGEKITSLFEYAVQYRLPVVGFTVSGGARMQEGLLSLMQMAKTSAAVKRHSDAGLLYIAVLTDPKKYLADILQMHDGRAV